MARQKNKAVLYALGAGALYLLTRPAPQPAGSTPTATTGSVLDALRNIFVGGLPKLPPIDTTSSAFFGGGAQSTLPSGRPWIMQDVPDDSVPFAATMRVPVYTDTTPNASGIYAPVPRFSDDGGYLEQHGVTQFGA